MYLVKLVLTNKYIRIHLVYTFTFCTIFLNYMCNTIFCHFALLAVSDTYDIRLINSMYSIYVCVPVCQ